jgi:hypothetical protein
VPDPRLHLAFSELIKNNQQRWVVWRLEIPPGKQKYTKPPYQITGRLAKNNDPSTWSTFEAAWAAFQHPGNNFTGIGLMLLELPGTELSAIDLDHVRNKDTGEILPWARKLVERAGYCEITPSGEGLRILGVTTGIASIHRKGVHPDGGEFELYIDCARYITVTGELRPGSSDALSDITPLFTTLRALLDRPGDPPPPPPPPEPDDGPAEALDLASLPKALAKLIREGVAEPARSQKFHGVVGRLRKLGHSFAVVLATLAAYPDGIAAKYAGRLETEVRRSWDRVDDAGGLVGEMNKTHAVVVDGNRVLVYIKVYNSLFKRFEYQRLSFRAFRELGCNDRVPDGGGKTVAKADVWLHSRRRLTYPNGVVFDPSGAEHPGALNLWEGFTVDPAPGDWSLLRAHMLETICGGNRTAFDYLYGYCARMMQFPAECGQVAIVLRGGQGVGKGFFIQCLMHLLGPAARQVAHARHLTGNFNAHLAGVVLLFGDEAFFAGDPSHGAVFKALVTERHTIREPKGVDPRQEISCVHLFLASNSDWVVPASPDDRRAFVLDVLDTHRNDVEYFAAIQAQMEAGGYAAMLHDLLAHDLTGFKVQHYPDTAALQEQKTQSFDSFNAWWLDVLYRGYVWDSDHGLDEMFRVWMDDVSTALLYKSYVRYVRDHRLRRALHAGMFGKRMAELADPQRLSNAVVGEVLKRSGFGGGATAEAVREPRPHGYNLGVLPAARTAFDNHTRTAIQWPHDTPMLVVVNNPESG